MTSSFKNTWKAFLCFSLITFNVSSASAAKIIVGDGSTFDLGSASLTSNTLEIENNGSFFWGSNSHQIFSFNNSSSGNADGESSYISLLQNWINNGAFSPATSTVEFLDLAPLSVISGDTSFYNFVVTSSANKSIQFEVSTTQSISNSITLTGVLGNLLKIRSTSATGFANIALDPSASQTIDYVDVSQNHSTLQHLAPGTTSAFSSIQGAGVSGWFLRSINGLQAVPTLNQISIFILLLLLIFASRRYIPINTKN